MLRDSFLDPICASVCYILSDGSTVEHANDTALRFIRSTAYKKTKALTTSWVNKPAASMWLNWFKRMMMKLWVYENHIYKLYMNYGVKNYMKDDHRSYRRNFCSCEKKYVFINLKKASTFYWSCRISIEPVVKLMWQIQIYAVTPCIKKKNGSVCFKRYWYPIFSLKQSSRYLADTMEGPVDVQVPNTVFCRRNFSYSETCMKRFN